MQMRHWFAAAVVAAASPAMAGDDVVALGRYQPSAGGFAGAVQTAAAKETQAANDGDTVLVHGRRYGYGYGRSYGGYSYGGYYGSGYRSSYSYYSPRYSYYPQSYSHYRPYYSSYYNSYSGAYYQPSYYSSSYSGGNYQTACYASSYPITSVVAAPTQTPTIVNNYYYTTPTPSSSLSPPRPMIPQSDAAPRYDGGPMNPIPAPTPDATKPMVPPNSNNVKISTTKSVPNKYPAYGDK